MASFRKGKKGNSSSGKVKRSRGKFKFWCGLFDRGSQEESVNPHIEFDMGKAESKRIQVVDKTPDVAFGSVPGHQSPGENWKTEGLKRASEQIGESNTKHVDNQCKMKAETNGLSEDYVTIEESDIFAEQQKSVGKLQLVKQHGFDTEDNANYAAKSAINKNKRTEVAGAESISRDKAIHGYIESDEEVKVRDSSKMDEAQEKGGQSDSSDIDDEKSQTSNSSYNSCEESVALEDVDCADGEDTGKCQFRLKKGIIRLQSKLLDAVLQQKLDDCSAEYFVQILNSPSAKIFAALRTKLRKNNQEWNRVLGASWIGLFVQLRRCLWTKKSYATLGRFAAVGMRRMYKGTDEFQDRHAVSCTA